MVLRSTGHMWHWTIASFLSRKISETERLCSDDIVSRLKGLVITSLTPFWWRNVINSLSDSDINLDTAMFSEGYAPVKVNPRPPPPTRAMSGNCGDLNLFSIDFDPPAGGKSAQIHDLRLRDRRVSGHFTIRWSAVSFSRLMVIFIFLTLPFFFAFPLKAL